MVCASQPAKRTQFVIYVYGDDGADEKKERATAVSVIGGYEDQWKDLEDKWKARCGGIPFHAKDCESDQGDYASTPHADNKALYRDLTTLLAKSDVGGFAVAIDLTAQKKIFPDSLELAYYRAFVECIMNFGNLAASLNDVAKFTFDISTENEYNAGLIYTTFRDSDAHLRKAMHAEISFVQARDSARVQTGDLLAYEGWKALDHVVGPVRRERKSWLALRETKRFETYSYSDDWFRDLKAHIDSGQLREKVKFDQRDYTRWLQDRRRHHNMSNLILFLDWIRRRDEGNGV